MFAKELTREFQLYVQFNKEHLAYLRSLVHPGSKILMRREKQLKYRWRDQWGHKGVTDWRKGKTRNVHCYSPDMGWFYFSDMMQTWARVPDADQEGVEELWRKSVNEKKSEGDI